MTKFDPKAIFNSADSFYEGAKIILKSAEKSMADPKQQTFRLPILPVITNMAFSLELYVKCLLVIEGKSPKQIHHIYKLYTKLSDKTKNELSKKISQWQQFGDWLQEISNAFEEWRYSYEKGQLSIDLEKMKRAITVFRNSIISVHPEWV